MLFCGNGSCCELFKRSITGIIDKGEVTLAAFNNIVKEDRDLNILVHWRDCFTSVIYIILKYKQQSVKSRIVRKIRFFEKSK